MTTEAEIQALIAGQPGPKREDMRDLDQRIRAISPAAELWFLDGKDETGKIGTNPNIGYGRQTQTYADGKTRDFYQVGISANTSGISVYIMGLEDKTHLSKTYAPRLGKATVTGYCIRFKRLADIDVGVLEEAIRFGFKPR